MDEQITDFREFYRIRIKRMVVILLDASGEIIPNNLGSSGFKFRIAYPIYFQNVGPKNETHTFKAQPRVCSSQYEG